MASPPAAQIVSCKKTYDSSALSRAHEQHATSIEERLRASNHGIGSWGLHGAQFWRREPRATSAYVPAIEAKARTSKSASSIVSAPAHRWQVCLRLRVYAFDPVELSACKTSYLNYRSPGKNAPPPPKHTHTHTHTHNACTAKKYC